jgi:hypothetical protein
MHLLIPFASALAAPPDRLSAVARLPRLQALRARLTEDQRDVADEWSFLPPHERALAQALGWPRADAQPWAAWQAPRDGIEPGDAAWGWITPAHWHLGTDQVSLLDPVELQLDEPAAREVFETLRELLTSAGYGFHYGTPLRWYVSHDSLAGLATASLDRVIGRNVDAWLGTDPAARRIRRLQSEVQMLLHTDPLNARREALGLLPVNSFWLSGCGVARPVSAAVPEVDDRLRAPALAGDWQAWVAAWQGLDAGPLADVLGAAESGRAVRLTLCGERASISSSSSATARGGAAGLARRLRNVFCRPAVGPLLEAL